MEQRVNIKFCFKMAKTATETVKQACGDNAVSRARVYEWYLIGLTIERRAWGSPGRSRRRASFNLSKFRHNRKCPWNCDTRSSMGSQNDGGWIYHQSSDLRKRKICTKFIPHRLTDEQKQRRLASRLVKTIPIFFIAFFSSLRRKLPSKKEVLSCLRH
jgi:hypothetical protein